METETELKSKKIANLIEYLEIFQCEAMNTKEFMKELENIDNPRKRMIIKDLIVSLETTQSQLGELINELKEKP